MEGTPVARGRSTEVVAGKEGQVVKLLDRGSGSSLAHREFQAQALAHELGAPTPAALGVIERDGRFGVVMERVEGLPMLSWFRARPLALARAFVELGAIHARLHGLAAPRLPPQKAFLARQIHAANLPEAVEAACLRMLEDLPCGHRLCHGDLHPGNVMWTASGPRVIDWGMACAGDPAADVARTLLLLDIARLPPGLAFLAPFRSAARRQYLRGYRRVARLPRQDLDAWWPPVAAARLAGENRHERAVLLPRIERACGRPG